MTKHVAKIRATGDLNLFYGYIVRVDYDGEESLINTYGLRGFKTRKAAEKSTSNYMKKYNLAA